MIIITSVNWIEVDGYYNVHDIYHYHPNDLIPVIDSKNWPTRIKTRVVMEQCRARTFINPQNQKRMIIGMDADTSNLLGLQYEAWETMERESENMRLDLIKKRKLLCNAVDRVVQLESSGLWTRIKAVFMGVE